MFKKIKIKNSIFIILLVIGLVIRITGSFFLGTQDVEWWKAWSEYASKESLLNIYGEEDKKVLPLIGHASLVEINQQTRRMIPYDSYKYLRNVFQCTQPPVLIYALFTTGHLYKMIRPEMPNARLYNFFNNLIPLVASILIAAAVYLFVKKIRSPNEARWAALLFWLSPLVLLNSPIQGYQDMLCAFFVVMSVIFAYNKKTLYSYILLAFSFMTKPQGILIAPIIFFAGLKDIGWRKNLLASTVTIITALIISLPFIVSHHALSMATNVLSVKNFNTSQLTSEALNAWWFFQYHLGPKIVSGNLNSKLFGVRISYIGHLIFLIFTFFNVRYLLRSKSKKREIIIFAAALGVYGYFMLETGILINHYFLMIPLLALIAVLNKRYFLIYLFVSIFFFAQDFLFYGFGRDFNLMQTILTNHQLLGPVTDIMSLISLALFVYLCFITFNDRIYSKKFILTPKLNTMIKNFWKIFLENKWLFLILLLATAVSVLFFFHYPNNPNLLLADSYDYNRLAKSLAQSHIYAENFLPNIVGHGASTYRPPGYPLFIALIYLIKFNSWRLVIVAQVMLFLISIVLLFLLAKKYFGRKIATITAAIYGGNFTIYLINNSFWTESLTLSLLIISAFFYYYFLGQKNRYRYLTLIVSGLAFGWLILVRPTFLIYLLVFGLLFFFSWIWKRKLNKTVLVFLIWALIPVIGWSARSTIVAKSAVLISTNGGINYLLGNNPYNINGRAAFWPSRDYLTENGITGGATLSESQLDHKSTRVAAKWIVRNPLVFSKLALSKIQYLFALDGDLSGNEISMNQLPAELFKVLKMLTFSLMLFFSLLGVYFVKKKKLLLWFLPYFLMIIATFADSRFVAPLFAPMSLLVALAVANFRQLFRNWSYPTLILLIFICQFSFFYPVLEKEIILAREYYRSSKDLKIMAEDKGNYFITDGLIKSDSEQIIYKKAPLGDSKKQIFYRNQDQIIGESELINLINKRQLYTDLTSVFIDINPETYPRLVDKNNFIYVKNLGKPILQIVGEESLPLASAVIRDQPKTSDWPEQIRVVNQFRAKANFEDLFVCELEPTSEIIITIGSEKITFDNYSSSDRTKFNLAFKNLAESVIAVGIKNNYSFGTSATYNIFSGQERRFLDNGVQIDLITETEEK
ncbi:MAG: glycosyltransferase family 39 protein [Candidatus Berkelbacteria bacterium]|nr:glycosyltransferase family 39 protein [Candidatus Berkelbacteria bacterium]